MADTPKLPVNVEIAKQNLRDAASHMSLSSYVRDHPYQSMGVAFLLGVLLADDEHARRALIGSEMLVALRRLQDLKK